MIAINGAKVSRLLNRGHLINLARNTIAISNMNLNKARNEMITMSEQVCKDAEQWQRGIQNGQAAMRQIRTINLKLFSTENKLNNADSHKILKTLTEIRDNTARMLSRLTLFLDDDTLAKHRITPKLESSKLLVVLQFLSYRYDAEWEVKEMVVNDLESISNSYELDLVMDCWTTCSHAGGLEFSNMMREYYLIIDRRQPLVKSI
ncbi:uncharacterized protein LOC122617280 isoform X2 [Drosophila teissieri]|uniref:uncharacterized protein LOC122617280 isoform X2 n=1 Tax=Drosophila teissieri TaxID=7243 RepID=UPI001CB9EC05|nr:uncharacterized protein LOC122617280 isoform X2 [Drosophila teissieri]